MLAQQIVNAAALGGIYALFAVGYTLVFGVLRILNLAQGALYTVGAVTSLYLVIHGAPFAVAFLGGMAVAGFGGWLLEVILFRRLRNRPAGQMSYRLMPLVGSIAFGIVVQSLLVLLVGVDIRRFPEASGLSAGFAIGTLALNRLQLLVLGLTLLLMALLHLVINHTQTGRAMRAVAENPSVARILGVRVDRVIGWTLILSSALAGAAGILIGIQSNMVFAYMGNLIELKGLAMMIVGGLGSVPGAVIAGFMIAAIEVFSVGYLAPGYQALVTFGILFCVLVVRPQGLLGRPEVVRP